MNYLLHLLILICLYSMLALSLNIAVGYGGMLSLCHAAFYGVGAYVTALLMVSAGWPFAVSVVVAVASSGVIAYLISVLAVRMRGDFFVLVTLGFQMIAFAVLYNWVDVTQGPYGISGIPRPSLAGLVVSSLPSFFLLTLITAVGCCALAGFLVSSPYGRTLQAVREDEVAAASLGKDTNAIKRSAFTYAGTIAGVPGALFATYSSYIDPTSFRLEESIFILCIVIIGGAGNIRGPLLGAVILVLIPELLRFLRVPDALAANMRQILYGLAIIIMMRARPQGLAGRYAFD